MADEAILVLYHTLSGWKIQPRQPGSKALIYCVLLFLSFANKNQLHFLRKQQHNEIDLNLELGLRLRLGSGFGLELDQRLRFKLGLGEILGIGLDLE